MPKEGATLGWTAGAPPNEDGNPGFATIDDDVDPKFVGATGAGVAEVPNEKPPALGVGAEVPKPLLPPDATLPNGFAFVEPVNG